MKTPATLLISVLLGLGSASRSSGQISVANPGFETPVVAQDDFTNTITGWTNPGTAGDTFIERVTGVTPADGGQYLGMEPNASVHQDLGINYAPNTVYRLRVAVGNRPGRTTEGNLSRIALTNPAGSATVSTTRDASALAPGSFADAPAVIVNTAARPALVGTPIRIRLSAAGAGRSHFDRVRIDTPLVVSTTADSGDGSLRAAVAFAASIPGPNTISFAPSLSGQTIILASGIAVTDTIGVTVDATGLSDGLTISVNTFGSFFSVGGGASLALRGLTLTGGNSESSAISNSGTLTITQCTLSGNYGYGFSGAISNSGTLTLTQCTLSNNSCDDANGGAIYNSGTMTLTQCTLSSNVGNIEGGAISNDGTLTLTQCTLSGNSAPDGGAIYNRGTLTLTQCTLSDNVAYFGRIVFGFGGGGGGAIATAFDSVLTMTDCTLSSNQADYGGAINAGGFDTLLPAVSLNRCTLSGNTAGNGSGGAMYGSLSNLTLLQCTVAGNTATGTVADNGYGGGIGCRSSYLTMIHCTIAANTANGFGGIGLGGGVFADGDSTGGFAIANTIIAGNTIAGNVNANGVDVYERASAEVRFTGRVFIGELGGNGFFQSPDVLVGALNLSPLGYYGGPTQTMVPLANSPVRDKASGTGHVGVALDVSITSDQRGLPIVGTPDIGAYEAGTPANYNAWIWESLPATATSAEHNQAFDFDGDGQGNEAEWSALTDPGNPNSRFDATTVRNGANLNITVPTVSGRTYTLLQSATLLDGSWSAVPGIAPQAGTGNPLVFPAPIGSGNLFFRAEVSVP